jgi:hypothetical protein
MPRHGIARPARASRVVLNGTPRGLAIPSEVRRGAQTNQASPFVLATESPPRRRALTGTDLARDSRPKQENLEDVEVSAVSIGLFVGNARTYCLVRQQSSLASIVRDYRTNFLHRDVIVAKHVGQSRASEFQ